MIELLKILIPMGLGIFSGIMKAGSEAKNEQTKMLMKKAGFEEESRKRAANLKGKGVAWTRRYIAILFSTTFVGVVLAIILAGIFNPEFVINIPKETFKHSIFSLIGFVDPDITVDYIELKGMVLVAPLIEKLMIITEIIVGFYFGAKVK